MSDASESTGRDRSPAYPNMPLSTALDRLTQFEAHFKRSAARPEKVGDAWNIKGKAYVDRTVAALRYFGLLEYQGAGKDRYVVVSEEGRKYLRAQQDEIKQEVIKAAALRPKAMAKFWNEWGTDGPADAARLDDLTLKHGFSDAGARDFLKVYDATIAFAGLSDADKVASPAGSEEISGMMAEHARSTVEIGPSQGVPKPYRVGDNMFAAPQPPGTRREVITLDEGDVVITFPEDLSSDSFGDLKDHLNLFIKKMQRRAMSPMLRLGSDEDDHE